MRRARSALSALVLAASCVALVATSYRNVVPGVALPVAVTLQEGQPEHRVHFVARYSRPTTTQQRPAVSVELQLARLSEPLFIRVEPRLTNITGDVTGAVRDRDTTLSVQGSATCTPECTAEYTVYIRRAGNDANSRATFTLQALTRFSHNNWSPPEGTRVITTLAPYPGAR